MLEMAPTITEPVPRTPRPKVSPPHVGEHIIEDVLPDLGLTVAEAAAAIGVTRQTLYRLCRGDGALTADLAVRLGKLAGVEPHTLLSWQSHYDIWHAEEKLGAELKRIKTRPRREE